MLLAGAGDRDAFELLVRRHHQPLLNFFLRMGVDRDAEDLVQQTFIRLYNYRQRYRPSAKFTTFLYLLARQVWVDELRRRGRRGCRSGAGTGGTAAGAFGTRIQVVRRASAALERAPPSQVVVMGVLRNWNMPRSPGFSRSRWAR